jgi:hypothetical protein
MVAGDVCFQEAPSWLFMADKAREAECMMPAVLLPVRPPLWHFNRRLAGTTRFNVHALAPSFRP